MRLVHTKQEIVVRNENGLEYAPYVNAVKTRFLASWKNWKLFMYGRSGGRTPRLRAHTGVRLLLQAGRRWNENDSMSEKGYEKKRFLSELVNEI